MSAIEAESEWLVALEKESKLDFLAKLAHTITVAGRNSYTPQAYGLAKPSQLRQINEIQHRVIACLVEVLRDQSSVSFQQSIAVWVLKQSDAELSELMSWAWFSTKEHSA